MARAASSEIRPSSLPEKVGLPRCRVAAFRGRYTPEGEAPHQRLLHVDDYDKASRWFAFPIGIELWVGGRFAMGGVEAAPPGVFAARIVALEPGRFDVGRLT